MFLSSQTVVKALGLLPKDKFGEQASDENSALPFSYFDLLLSFAVLIDSTRMEKSHKTNSCNPIK